MHRCHHLLLLAIRKRATTAELKRVMGNTSNDLTVMTLDFLIYGSIRFFFQP